MQDFPRRAVDLTPEWLGATLGLDLVGFTLTPLGEERGNLGEIVRVDLEYDVDRADETLRPSSVVAKFAADRAGSLAAAHRSGLFAREIQFYEHVAPGLGSLVPRCFAESYDPITSHFVLLLEDLSTDGGELDVVSGVGPVMTDRVLSSLATLHTRGRALADQFSPGCSP